MSKSFSIILLCVFFITCSKPTYDYSKLSIRLTDAPADYKEILIDIQGVSVYYKTDDVTLSWHTLENVNTGIYNLFDFQNGKDTLLAATDIISGRLSEIRLILGENNSLVTDEGTFPLKVPSGASSGLKIKIIEEIEYNEYEVIFLDFDAYNSIVKEGNGRYSLKPVIRAYTTESTGIIEGTIIPSGVYTKITITSDNESYQTIANEDGYFQLKGIPQGTYNINVVPEPLYIEKTLTNIEVVNNSTNNIGTIQIESELVNNNGIVGVLSGDLNINPSTNDSELFELQAPSGQIILEGLEYSFSYNGPATEIKIIPKGTGKTLILNGVETILEDNIRYTLSSTESEMNVYLRNTKESSGHWWISISGEEIKINPIP